MEAAGGAERRRQRELVRADQADQEPRQSRGRRDGKARSRSSRSASRRTERGKSRLAINTRSHDPNSALRPRNHSRASRLMRLRSTAPPTLRVTVTPRRLSRPSLRSNTKTVKNRVARRVPSRVDVRKSRRRIRRPTAPRESAMPSGSLLPLGHSRERMTTLRAALREHASSARGAHASAEPVVAGSANAAGLKGALHGESSGEV